MSQYFGHSPQDWERSMMRGAGSGSAAAMKDAMNNPENYTTAMPNGSSKAAFAVGSMVGAGRDGLKKGPDTVYYKVEKPSAPAPATPAPAPAPPPKPVEKKLEADTFKYSPEIQQAKDRVDAYENKSSSPWDKAQATVQSSFIKDTGSSPNNQYDFSGNTFEAKESAKPNKQEQAALNQMQNYISKYSSHN